MYSSLFRVSKIFLHIPQQEGENMSLQEKEK